MTSYKRGPYKMRANAVTCGRCGTKHKKNQCPKRIPRSLKIPKVTLETRQKAATERSLAAQKDTRAQRRKEQREQKRLKDIIAERAFLLRIGHMSAKDIPQVTPPPPHEEGPEQWEAEVAELLHEDEPDSRPCNE